MNKYYSLIFFFLLSCRNSLDDVISFSNELRRGNLFPDTLSNRRNVLLEYVFRNANPTLLLRAIRRFFCAQSDAPLARNPTLLLRAGRLRGRRSRSPGKRLTRKARSPRTAGDSLRAIRPSSCAQSRSSALVAVSSCTQSDAPLARDRSRNTWYATVYAAVGRVALERFNPKARSPITAGDSLRAIRPSSCAQSVLCWWRSSTQPAVGRVAVVSV
ncbi:unnamed protein product [Acanthosepion pharaonis]|uniref:Uncharacterized protein n=1 Tax=Acanthosepion pharaonis TaxID=158019 RepID=A0A812ECN4_ACAPH|nr:unnamed protein product [Sepia pharaonis]